MKNHAFRATAEGVINAMCLMSRPVFVMNCPMFMMNRPAFVMKCPVLVMMFFVRDETSGFRDEFIVFVMNRPVLLGFVFS